MRSLSIIIGAKTALGKALIAVQDPGEVVVCATSHGSETKWLEQHYPWFPVIEKPGPETPLPFTGGPVRIYFCSFDQYFSGETDAASVSDKMLDDLTLLRSIIGLCGNYHVHISFVSSAFVSRPSPLSMCPLTVETQLETLCRKRPSTLLSVFHPGHCFDRRLSSANLPFMHTSYMHLGRLMIKAAVSDKSYRMVVGLDARFEAVRAKIRNVWADIKSPKHKYPSKVKHTVNVLHVKPGCTTNFIRNTATY